MVLKSLPPPSSSSFSSQVEKLWSFSCPMTHHRVVHAMSWCHGGGSSHNGTTNSLAARHDHVARDLLAVGYSESQGPLYDTKDDANTANGLVLFWSLRNPHHPERSLYLPTGVTTLDFSTHHPNLLAVGLRDGSIYIFDMHKEDQYYREPIMDTSTLECRHTDPVWQLRWVDKGVEQGEGLVSISTDGRIMEWSTSKGMSAIPLMTLKRVGNLTGKISNQASGLSFAFLPNDPSIYLASTEDGLIHRCSVSYNEQYLDTYMGHTGPVYKVVASPFWPRAFLTCAGDWTVRLWNTKDAHSAVYVLQSSELSAAEHDVVWSHHSPTLFASVTGDGRLMVWDLAVSTIDPLVVEAWTPDSGSSSSHHYYKPVSAPASRVGGGEGSVSSSTSTLRGSPRPETNESSDGRGDDSSRGKEGEGGGSKIFRPEFTSVVFYEDTPLVAVGDSQGGVSCYKLTDVVEQEALVGLTAADKANRLRAAMYPEAFACASE